MPTGLFLFFIFFGLALVAFQLFIGVLRLWAAGHVPKILLVASAHAVPLSAIVQRVGARRLVPVLLAQSEKICPLCTRSII
jgi:hypothetical protein